MTAFTLAARLAALDAAIAAATAAVNAQPPVPQAQTWLDQMTAERAALGAAPDADKDDVAFRDAAVLWARTLPTAAAVLAALASDPIYLARGVSPTTVPAVAQAVAANPNRRAIWGSTPGLTAAMLDELYGEGHRWWLNQPAETRPPLTDAERPLNDVAALIPVTIETRFYAADATHPAPRVRVRVTPDDISVNRHRPTPTSFELERVRELRMAMQAIPGGPPALDKFLTENAAGKALWLRLCDAVTPARAAWLVTTTAGQDLGAVTPDDTHRPVRVDGFPDRIEVWVAWTGGGTQQIGVGRDVQRDRLVFDLPKDNADAWWNSWTAAVELGVGIECELPREPAAIEALYVLGLSDETPAKLFADKVATGEFGSVEPGAPTNTIHGDPAADLARDPATWAALAAQRLRLAAAGIPARSEHSGPMTGKDDALGLYPGPAFDHDDYSRALIGAVYPALWGHPLKDIWALGSNAHALARWMFEWVRPAGHLLAIRCGDLPYGIVPATALGRWRLSPVETRNTPELGAVEPALVAALTTVRASLAEQARGRGTTVDADTQRLVTLVSRTPTAVGYSYQAAIPSTLMESLLSSVPGGGFDANRRAAFEDALRQRWAPASRVRQGQPQRQYVTFGNLRDIKMPLVLPVHFPEVPPEQAARLSLPDRIRRLIDLLRRLQELRRFDEQNLFEQMRGVLADSLLFRLLLQASMQARADVARADPDVANANPLIPGRGDGPRLEPESSNQRPVAWQWAELLSLGVPGPVKMGTPAGQTFQLVAESIRILSNVLQDELDRAQAAGSDKSLETLVNRLEIILKNTLDTAATRIDPFVTGLAWRRLNTLRGEATTRYRLGIYGWVDAPKHGQPGPKPGGLLHAPSHSQVVTSIILRDRYLLERGFDGGPGKAWQMSITSERVRMAEEIADEVRMGAHVREALGRRVEAIVDDPVHIRELRETIAPQRAAAPDRFSVCNGDRVLSLLRDNALPAWVSADQRTQLQAWADAMQVYADLLVAQGVHHTLAGRHDAASGTMNAAAGFNLPPELEVVQTPRAGQSVLSSLLAVLAYVPTPAPPPEGAEATHPAQLADASVGAYIDATFGPPEDWQWTFSITGLRQNDAPVPPPNGNPPPEAPPPLPVSEVRTVSLAGLGLTPMDAALYPPDKLAFAMGQFALDDVAGGIPNLLSLTVDSTTATPNPERHRLARELVAVLAGKPFEFHDLHLAGTADAAAEMNARDEAIRQDLLARLAALLAAGNALHGVLADPARAAVGLRLALRWGIAPIDRTMTVEERRVQAAAALDARVQKAQAFLDAATAAAAAAANALGRAEQAAVGQIAEAINELAAPEGQLAILSPVSNAQLAQYEPEHPIQPAPKLDEEWLTVLAAVRPRLARLEAVQLEPLRPNPPANFNGLVAYANRPDDVWQRAAVTANRSRRLTGQAFQPSRLIAAYATARAWDGPRVAVGSIDNWAETVPEPRHTTQAAFHFNAPGARAPQAVVLAVPPVIDQPLDTATLLDIVRETRELAQARMAAVEDLGPLDTPLPFSLLSAPAPWSDALLNDRWQINF